VCIQSLSVAIVLRGHLLEKLWRLSETANILGSGRLFDGDAQASDANKFRLQAIPPSIGK
jgi:hypothetical protein